MQVLKISEIEIQIRIRFGMVNSINTHLAKNSSRTKQLFNFNYMFFIDFTAKNKMIKHTFASQSLKRFTFRVN